jgi:hypothetical protein
MVWTPNAIFPVVETERVNWQPPGSEDGLVIPLDALFEGIERE